MAKVKIQGHASGTGILTVTAPNTSTDRTITLPDATGTLLNSDGSGASLTGIAGRRNMIINGAMRVAQRATSASVSDGSNEGYNTLDRWYMQHSSSAGGVSTISQDTTVPNTSFANSLKIDVTTADTSVDVNHAITLQHRLEAQDIANSGWDYTNSSSKLSVSFWARSVKAGTYCVFFFTQDGTTRNLVQEYTLVANTWKYVELTFKGDSSISFADDNGLGLIIGWTFAAGSNRYENVTADEWITRSDGNNQGRYATSNQVNFFDSTSNDFYLTGVQMELGSVATNFEHRSYGEELALCQRYFEKFGNPDGVSGNVFFGITSATNATSARGPIVDFKVTKRALPTIALTGSLYYLSGPAWVSTAGWEITTRFIFGSQTTTSGVAGTAYTLSTTSGAGNYITADAEL